MPLNAETGSLGRRTTVPSGCIKNFARSPGFKRRCSRIAFGIVAWPLTVIADSMFPHYIIINVTPQRSTGVKLCPITSHWQGAQSFALQKPAAFVLWH
jgi:hypothetical protein